MKNINLAVGGLLVLGIFIIVKPAMAEQRVKVFELAESGQTVEFPMTPEEIAAADAENDRLTALRKAQLEKPKKRVVEFELSESGVIIEFPVFGAETSK